jgi:DNA-binding CsgD family transcriptional regulator
MAEQAGKRRHARSAVGLQPPEDLVVHSFVLGSDEYLLLDFPLRNGRRGVGFTNGLTPGERAVLELILGGQSTSEIARARGTSLRTVANQIAAIYRKVGVRSRRELFARQRSNGGTI